jgi:hypothetical protein
MICLLIILLVLFPSCKWTELESAERSVTPNRDEEHIEQEHERILQELLKPPGPVSHVSTPSSALSPDMKDFSWSAASFTTPPNTPNTGVLDSTTQALESLSLNTVALTEDNLRELRLSADQARLAPAASMHSSPAHTPTIFKKQTFFDGDVTSPPSDQSRRLSDESANSDISYVDISRRHMSKPSLDRLGYSISCEDHAGVEYFFGSRVYTVHYGDHVYPALEFAGLMKASRSFTEWLVMTEREFRNRQVLSDQEEAKIKAAAAFKEAEIASESALNAEIKAAVARVDKKEDVYE